MGSENPQGPQQPQGPQPFIPQQDRPDLTIDLNRKVGELTVRELQSLLGGGASPAKLKELAKEKEALFDKIPAKDHKDLKDHKDHKEPKDQKDQKETKDNKDQKDPKETKDNKDQKDPKEQKDTKDHKDPKEHKDEKDIKDRKDHKEGLLEKVPHKDQKDQAEKLPEVAGKGGAGEGPTGLEDLIRRVSGLEKDVQDLKGPGRGPAK